MTGLDPADIARVVRDALAEDLRYGPDVTTTAIIPADAVAVADIVARQPGVIAGLPVVAAVLDATGGGEIDLLCADGDSVKAGEVIARIRGPLGAMLGAERTLLNFLTHLSGIATATRAWADAIEGTGASVRDTRKTLPGLRVLEKYAVRCGGGQNHRFGLDDAVLVKDNHLALAGSIAAAVALLPDSSPAFEVEAETLDDVEQALAVG